LADVELLVEMGQLSASVLEEEFPVQGEGRCEDVDEQETTVGKDVRRICLPDDNLERDKEFEFTHEREGDAEHHSNRDEKCVGNHLI